MCADEADSESGAGMMNLGPAVVRNQGDSLPVVCDSPRTLDDGRRGSHVVNLPSSFDLPEVARRIRAFLLTTSKFRDRRCHIGLQFNVPETTRGSADSESGSRTQQPHSSVLADWAELERYY